MHETTSDIDQAYIQAARRIHTEDGVCEIDDNAKVSVSEDGGAYVQAWVWVYETDITEETDKE